MKIVFTGGGSGGHFYPIIAVAEEIQKIVREQKLLEPKLYFIAPDPYNAEMLFRHGIIFKKIPSGKRRIYSSIQNILDIPKTLFGIIKALWIMFWLYPEVVFSKGGYGSFPVTFAARVLGIPVIIHESDSVPGRANKLAGKFAKRIAISFPSAGDFFSNDKVALTGSPLRNEILNPIKEGSASFFGFDESIPTILILGGSQGAQIINDTIINALPKLLEKYQIIHQTGPKNFDDIIKSGTVHIEDKSILTRYKPYPYLDVETLKKAVGMSNLIISRAGSTIFEISAWAKPSILIPITESNGDHQRKNAYEYARAGACSVIEENNLSDDVLIQEVDRILSNQELKNQMTAGAIKFFKPNAARTIANEILVLGSH